ncbi:MAG: hypothetical protein BWY68_00687 [bacterium ADurb.Bin400]|nr:MAG: hypothetical protein BWY68_00687 [bacterium ADurb.Bin400]
MDVAMIQKRIQQLELLENENRACKEMLQSELENDPNYMEAYEEAKASAQKKKRLKDEILGRGPNQKLLLEIKENLEEIATLKEILSAELVQVYTESNSDEIEDADGESRKFKVQVKLLPKRGKYQGRNSYGQYDKDDMISTEDVVAGI